MNKQTFKKLSAAALAVVLAAPSLTLVQNSLLGDLLANVDKNSKVAYATGGGNPASLITNTATVTSETLDTNTFNNTATVEDKFCFSTDIAITSFTDSLTSAQAEQAVTYTTVITNNGVSKLETLAFDFAFDSTYLDETSISFSSSVGTVNATGSAGVYAGTINFPSFLNPTSTVTLTISGLEVLPTAVDGQSYQATLDIIPTETNFDDCAITDPNLTNNDAADSTTNVRVADLSLIKTSSGGANSSTNTVGRLNAGQAMSYTLSVTNNGPSEAEQNIVVTDTWPSQITPTVASGANYTASGTWNCAYSAPTMTCTNTNPLANGASSSIVINGTVNQTY
jgi:uncharacterized repeat protein (TIGR01451 family)